MTDTEKKEWQLYPITSPGYTGWFNFIHNPSQYCIGMVPPDKVDLIRNLIELPQDNNCHQECQICETPLSKFSSFSLCDKCKTKFGKDNNKFGHSGDKTVSSYPKDNQQPPKEEIHGRCIKHGLFYCPHCEEMTLQPKCECGNRYAGEPKERKVSLEEIRDVVSGKYNCNCEHCYGRQEAISQAILSLINATEERKGE